MEKLMKKIIFIVIKKIILAVFLVYAFNLLVSGLKIFIPINVITVSVVASLGMSGLLALVAIYFDKKNFIIIIRNGKKSSTLREFIVQKMQEKLD